MRLNFWILFLWMLSLTSALLVYSEGTRFFQKIFLQGAEFGVYYFMLGLILNGLNIWCSLKLKHIREKLDVI